MSYRRFVGHEAQGSIFTVVVCAHFCNDNAYSGDLIVAQGQKGTLNN